MKKFLLILFLAPSLITFAYGKDNFTQMTDFNMWLKKNNSNMRVGCDEKLSKIKSDRMSEVTIKKLYKVYCYDENNIHLLENEENNLEIRSYKGWSIPFLESPDKDTLTYYLYRYIYSHLNGDTNTMQWGKYMVQPSDNSYEFKTSLTKNKFITQQMDSKAILSYLYFEDETIYIDEMSPKERFGDFIDNKTKLRSNSVGKTIVSYVLGHAICNDYIENIDAKINDWPLVKGTLYEDQKLIDLLNMAAGDQKFIDTWRGTEGIDYGTSTIEDVMPYFKNKKPSQRLYNYNNLISPLILNYISYKTGDDFQLLLNKVFKEKVKIKDSVYFFKKKGKHAHGKKNTKESGNAQNMFFATRHDYLRIAKAMMDDYQNQTCEGKYLKEVYNRKINKGKNKGHRDNFGFSHSYGGQFHMDYPGLKNQVVFGMNGYGGQAIMIDMNNSRIVVLNAIHYNNAKYKYNHKRLLLEPIKKGIRESFKYNF